MSEADLTPTGRELRDPAATLVECVDDRGLKHTVIAFDEPYRGHTALTTGVDLIQSFMAYPMVTGLVECTSADTELARFAYPTGTIWTVKEVMRGFDQVGQTVGTRAALEICYLAGMILDEAGETGPMQGCFSHGNLTPWRIGLKGDGQLQVFGYGLAQVEMYEFVKGSAEHIDNDAIRYAPPERLEGQPEQPSSDTYSLAVLAHELITGKPLFDQKEGKKMWESVKMAEGVQRMLKAKGIAKNVREILANALIYDPDTRLSGQAFVDSVGNLLDDPKLDGRTMTEVMKRMNATARKSSRKLVNVKGAATAAFDAKALAAMAEEPDDAEETTVGGEAQPRWGAVSRERTTGRGRRQARAEPPKRKRKSTSKPAEEESAQPRRRRRRTAEAPPPVTDSPRRRRRTKDEPKSDAAEASPEEVQADTPDASPVAEPPRRRRKRPGADAKEANAEEDAAAPEEAEEPPRRRRRRRSGEADAEESASEESASEGSASEGSASEDTPAEAPVEDAEPAEPAADPPRRRRRSAASKTGGDEKPSGEAEAAAPPKEEEPPRRRRRKSQKAASADEAPPEEATDTPKSETPATDAEEPADPPRRRRRRKKS